MVVGTATESILMPFSFLVPFAEHLADLLFEVRHLEHQTRLLLDGKEARTFIDQKLFHRFEVFVFGANFFHLGLQRVIARLIRDELFELFGLFFHLLSGFVVFVLYLGDRFGEFERSAVVELELFGQFDG